jgi:4-hydroxymandelate oxidase
MNSGDKQIAIGEHDVPETPSRRKAFKALGAAITGVAALGAVTSGKAQPVVRTPLPAPKQPPRTELVNVFQFQDQARAVLGAERLAPVVDTDDRSITDRITLRPRLNVPIGDIMDLTTPLFGDDHFTPVIVGPVASQRRFHPEGEIAMARGASAARAGLVISSDTDAPLAQIAAATTSPLWVQVYAGSPGAAQASYRATEARARAIVVTLNAVNGGGAISAAQWASVEAIASRTPLPVVVKGITRPEDAKRAMDRGARGVVVSSYSEGRASDLSSPLLLIQPVVEAVGGQVPVLADGGFRYGSDLIKALAFGATAVLVSRPVVWGLGSYGAGGVESVVKMLQTDLARFMANTGRPTIPSINTSLVRVHAPRPPRSDTNV